MYIIVFLRTIYADLPLPLGYWTIQLLNPSSWLIVRHTVANNVATRDVATRDQQTSVHSDSPIPDNHHEVSNIAAFASISSVGPWVFLLFAR
ncbi:hypothetical protein RSOLAG1IB_06272 [Rhizoctonia solani AG-1 IB]|uniref:Uncharacterized protein n=1 Tax=Thanatephorus cucumeris (strain AG1-IB / isolate 7/3/14) TaxID=1108050 RepID=A0A0B7F6X9_THACB|nr:hypothetical protein RSOLAG1IB_06272 [Rhizoctonia solani AG-1 IB]